MITLYDVKEKNINSFLCATGAESWNITGNGGQKTLIGKVFCMLGVTFSRHKHFNVSQCTLMIHWQFDWLYQLQAHNKNLENFTRNTVKKLANVQFKKMLIYDFFFILSSPQLLQKGSSSALSQRKIKLSNHGLISENNHLRNALQSNVIVDFSTSNRFSLTFTETLFSY